MCQREFEADLRNQRRTPLAWVLTVVNADTTAPVISANFAPVGLTNTPSPNIYASVTDTGSGVDTSSIVVLVDGATAVSLPTGVIGTPTAAGVDISFTASALSLGAHHVSVNSKDLLGNAATPLNWVFTVVNADTTPPTISFNAPVGLTNTPSPNIYASVTDTGVGVDTSTIVMTVDGSIVTPTLGAPTAAGVDISFWHALIDTALTPWARTMCPWTLKDLLGNKAARSWELGLHGGHRRYHRSRHQREHVPVGLDEHAQPQHLRFERHGYRRGRGHRARSS